MGFAQWPARLIPTPPWACLILKQVLGIEGMVASSHPTCNLLARPGQNWREEIINSLFVHAEIV